MTSRRTGWTAWAMVLALVATGLSVAGSGRTHAQGEPTIFASATCVGETADRAAFVYVTVVNGSGRPIQLIAVEGFSTSQAFNPFFLEEAPDDLLNIEVPDGERVAVDARWSGLIGGDGEGLVAGAVVVTSLGVLTPICSDRSQDAGRLIVDLPLPSDPSDRRLQEARTMAETLGRLEGWRAYPVLYALLHPDARDAVSFDQLACWYVGQYGGRLDPERLDIFSTTVSVGEVEPWTWEANGETYDEAISYDYQQEIGTIVETETVSGNAHLVLEDGVWRWFFGSSQDGLDALPSSCDLDVA